MNQTQPQSLEHLYRKVLNLQGTHYTLEYEDKMITDLPNTDVVDRRVFILKHCVDKVVFDIGCNGSFHAEVLEVSKKCYGIDQVAMKDVPDFTQMVIGKEPIPIYPDVEIVLCGEIMEHLSNPGAFLDELKAGYPTHMKIFSVPNAFSQGHHLWIKKGQENTNKDHVAYYTYVTLSCLLKRHGYSLKEFYWYDNPEHISVQGLNEGMVAITT